MGPFPCTFCLPTALIYAHQANLPLPHSSGTEDVDYTEFAGLLCRGLVTLISSHVLCNQEGVERKARGGFKSIIYILRAQNAINRGRGTYVWVHNNNIRMFEQIMDTLKDDLRNLLFSICLKRK